MYVIIVGGGKMGSSLAEKMSDDRHDIVIIDSDPAVCRNLTRLNVTVINGDAIDMKILEEAGIERADVIAALTPKDEVNLFSCLMAKSRKKCRLVSRITHKEYEKIFKALGIHIVVNPESVAAQYIENLIVEDNNNGK